MKLISIDPGPEQSAFVAIEGGKITDHGIVPNPVMREFFKARLTFLTADYLAIEMIACYGMPVGRETFDTCRWIGRFQEAWERNDCRGRVESKLVYRRDIKIHLCGSMKAKDGNIRQALLDRWGKQGTKKEPGPTYGISSHEWAALAVATYFLDTKK